MLLGFFSRLSLSKPISPYIEEETGAYIVGRAFTFWLINVNMILNHLINSTTKFSEHFRREIFVYSSILYRHKIKKTYPPPQESPWMPSYQENCSLVQNPCLNNNVSFLSICVVSVFCHLTLADPVIGLCHFGKREIYRTIDR